MYYRLSSARHLAEIWQHSLGVPSWIKPISWLLIFWSIRRTQSLITYFCSKVKLFLMIYYFRSIMIFMRPSASILEHGLDANWKSLMSCKISASNSFSFSCLAASVTALCLLISSFCYAATTEIKITESKNFILIFNI